MPKKMSAKQKFEARVLRVEKALLANSFYQEFRAKPYNSVEGQDAIRWQLRQRYVRREKLTDKMVAHLVAPVFC
jgi:hypothetical protein